MGALKNLRRREAGERGRKEEVLIRQLVTGEWSGAGDMPACSSTELVTVALDADPIEDYCKVLDARQREIVNRHRSWETEAVPKST